MSRESSNAASARRLSILTLAFFAAPLSFAVCPDFRNGTSVTTGSVGMSVAAADFDADGNRDAVITRNNETTILLGNGDGTFMPGDSFYVDAAYAQVKVADLNNDRRADIIVDEVTVMLNNGNGTFGAPISYGYSFAAGFTTGDFNGDKNVDVATRPYAIYNTISILFGNGTGGFGSPVTYPVDAGSSSLFAADFNGDGWQDLAVSISIYNGVVSIYLNNGDGTFAPRVNYAVNYYPNRIIAGDFNADGIQDLATANRSGGGTTSVLLGNGNGTFAAAVHYTTGTQTNDVVAGDFNGDGNTDLATANDLSADTSVLLGNGNGTFATAVNYAVGVSPQGVVSGDFNHDFKPDLLFALNAPYQRATILLGDGSAGFVAPREFNVSSPTGLTVADMNGNGRPDLVVTSGAANAVYILSGNADGTFGAPSYIPAGTNPNASAAADFNGDGRLDLAVADQGTDSSNMRAAILLQNSNGTFQSPVLYDTAGSPFAIAIADFNADSRPDLAVANYTSNNFSILLGNSNGTFAQRVNYTTGQNPRSIAVADFNGDNIKDLAIASETFNGICIHLGTGNGVFGAKVSYTTAGVARALALGDFNGDGHQDVAATNWANSIDKVSIRLGAGNGTLGAEATFDVIPSPERLVIGDINADGKADILTTTGGSISVLIGNGNGTFAPNVLYSAGGNPVAIALGNFNGDGQLDAAVVNTYAGAGILLNRGCATLSPDLDRPTSLVATATSATSVQLTWTPVSGATQYEIYRWSGGAPVAIFTPGSSYTDNAVAANQAYVYAVRALGATSSSGFSNSDLATTTSFTDSPLVQYASVIRAVHITELRTVVNQIHALAGLGTHSFTDSVLSGNPIKALHLTQLRAAIDAARAEMSLPGGTFLRTLNAQSTTVNAQDVTEIRSSLQ